MEDKTENTPLYKSIFTLTPVGAVVYAFQKKIRFIFFLIKIQKQNQTFMLKKQHLKLCCLVKESIS